jgi:hypothetical protein
LSDYGIKNVLFYILDNINYYKLVLNNFFISFGPRSLLGDFERLNWGRISGEHRERKVNSIGDLVSLFPDGEIVVAESGKELFGEPTCDIYDLVEEGFPSHVAYHCHSCDEIIMGPPLIQDYDNIEFLSGARGYTVSCAGCSALLENVDIEVS